MVTINGLRIHKVIGISLVFGNDNSQESQHIRIDFWHDKRMEMNSEEVLKNFEWELTEEPGEDINYGSIFLPMESEIHFKT